MTTQDRTAFPAGARAVARYRFVLMTSIVLNVAVAFYIMLMPDAFTSLLNQPEAFPKTWPRHWGFQLLAINGLYLLGVGQMEEKRLTEAQTSLNRSLGFAVDVGFDAMLHNVRASLASVRFLSGDVAATLAIEQEIDNAEALKDGYGAARARVALAEALLSIGNAERAQTHVRAAVEWFAARDMRPYVLRSLNLLSAVLSALGDEQGSEESARRAAEVRTSIEWPTEVGRSPEAGLRQGPAEVVGPGGT